MAIVAASDSFVHESAPLAGVVRSGFSGILRDLDNDRFGDVEDWSANEARFALVSIRVSIGEGNVAIAVETFSKAGRLLPSSLLLPQSLSSLDVRIPITLHLCCMLAIVGSRPPMLGIDPWVHCLSRRCFAKRIYSI